MSRKNKGYNSDDVLCDLEEAEIRSYAPEPKRKPRNWKGKEAEKKATQRNRKRTKGRRGKQLQRKRAEYNERSFAHTWTAEDSDGPTYAASRTSRSEPLSTLPDSTLDS